MPPPRPASAPIQSECTSTSPRTPIATSRSAKPAACETRVTANAGSRRVSKPPAKSAAPHVTEEPSASASARKLSSALDEHGHALATADAHRLETDRAIHRLEVVQQGVHDPGACHAVGVAE